MHYPSGQWMLWCAESRPYEAAVSERLNALVPAGYETVVIADNMVGVCLFRKKAAGVFLFYQRKVNGGFSCQGGSLLVAVLAQECGIPCNLHPTDFDPDRAAISSDLSFAGTVIVPKGVKSFVPRTDRIPIGYCTKVW